MPYCDGKVDIESENIEFTYEVMEACINCFESFVRKCPKEIGNHV